MNPITVLAGVVLTGYGLHTAWARRARPEQFKKLAAMRSFWGEKGGQLVHVMSYTAVPIIVGIVLMLVGLRGASLF